jgi:hypothetical protein
MQFSRTAPNNPTDCVFLPIIKGGRIVNVGDVLYQGDVITLACNPALLISHGPNPANTYFNQLACATAVSKNGGVPVATTPPSLQGERVLKPCCTRCNPYPSAYGGVLLPGRLARQKT